MTGQQRLEALLRTARVYESHDMAMAAPEVQAAIREMAPLVELDPVREMAVDLYHGWDDDRNVLPDGDPSVAVWAARAASEVLADIDAELARLRTSSAPRIK